MSDGLGMLEQRIQRFEELLEEMNEATREAHSALKQLRVERRETERYLANEGKKLVEKRVDEVIKKELDKIGPEVRAQTSLIYSKVGKEIDKLIDIALGKEFSTVHGRSDLRPELAEKLKGWMREIIERDI